MMTAIILIGVAVVVLGLTILQMQRRYDRELADLRARLGEDDRDPYEREFSEG